MKKYSTSDRLKQLMKARNLRQVDILEAAEPYCNKYGVKLETNALSQYVSGKVEPGQEKLSILWSISILFARHWTATFPTSSSVSPVKTSI